MTTTIAGNIQLTRLKQNVPPSIDSDVDEEMREEEVDELIPKDDDISDQDSHEEYELDPCRSDIRFVQRFHRLLALSIVMECVFCIYTTTIYGPSSVIGCILTSGINVLIFCLKTCNFPFIRGEQGLNLLLVFYVVNSLVAIVDFAFAQNFFTTNHGLAGCVKYQLKKNSPQFIGDMDEIESAKECTLNQEVVWWNCYCYNAIQDSCVVTEAYNGDSTDAIEGCNFMVSTVPLLVWAVFVFSLLNGGFFLGTTAYLFVKRKFGIDTR